MKIPVGISNRHVHLTKETFLKLFNKDDLTLRRELLQPGEYACEETVSVIVGDKIIENVRIIGPFRKYNQVELLKTDAKFLGINPPLANSGELMDAAEVTLVGTAGGILLEKSTIIANRHIHLPLKLVEKFKCNDKDIVSVKMENGNILNNVHIKISNEYELEFHINKDEAEEIGLDRNQEVTIC